MESGNSYKTGSIVNSSGTKGKFKPKIKTNMTWYKFTFVDGKIIYQKGFDSKYAIRRVIQLYGCKRDDIDSISVVKKLPRAEKEIKHFWQDNAITTPPRYSAFTKECIKHILKNEHEFTINTEMGTWDLEWMEEHDTYFIVKDKKVKYNAPVNVEGGRLI